MRKNKCPAKGRQRELERKRKRFVKIKETQGACRKISKRSRDLEDQN